MNYQLLGAADAAQYAVYPQPDMDRARDLQRMINAASEQAMRPGISGPERRELEKKIATMEAELDGILQNRAQSQTPHGYYTSERGIMPVTGRVAVEPALVLGDKNVEPKKNPWPWIAGALAIAAGTTYFTLKG